MRAHPTGEHAGVVLLRLSHQQRAAVITAVSELLVTHDLDSLAAALVGVTDRGHQESSALTSLNLVRLDSVQGSRAHTGFPR